MSSSHSFHITPALSYYLYLKTYKQGKLCRVNSLMFGFSMHRYATKTSIGKVFIVNCSKLTQTRPCMKKIKKYLKEQFAKKRREENSVIIYPPFLRHRVGDGWLFLRWTVPLMCVRKRTDIMETLRRSELPSAVFNYWLCTEQEEAL